MRAPHALLGIMLIGLGADPILDPSAAVWSWGLLVFASLVGGLNLGISFMGFAEQAAPTNVPRPPKRTTQSDG